MFTLPHQQSFHPPAQPDAGGSNPNPDHVLLAVRAYIADRTNSTTATSCTSEGHRIQVSFFAAEPPALTHLCVYCPDAAFTAEPRVIASHGNLILFDVGIRSSSDPFGEEIRYDDFVYSADGTGRASLDLLPKPRHPISRADIGLVASAAGSRGGGGGYTVVTLDPDPSCKRYILHLHHEKTGRWRRKVVSRMILVTDSSGGNGKDLKDEVLNFTSTKAIALQGSSVIAWVDLRRAVLLCDVLDKDPVAYYMPLPEPLNHRNKEYLESPANPCSLRDAVGGQNSVKFVEMEYRYGADFAAGGWKAVTYSWAIGSKNWCMDSVVDFDDVLENSGDMLLSLCPDKSRGLESNNIPPLRVPTLCDRDNVLYLMSKINHRCTKGSVVVVDTSMKALKSVTPMSDERVIGYALTFVHCTFSKHLNDVADIWPKMEDRTCNAFLDLYIGRENFSKAVDKSKAMV